MRMTRLVLGSLLLPGALLSQTLVKDINTTSTNPSSSIGLGVAIGGTAYFSAVDSVNGQELWKTDGTAAGTVLVKDINPGSLSSSPSGLRNVGGTLFFYASTAATGLELWKSDGSAAGTVLVKDVNPGTGGGISTTANYGNAAVGSTFYFVGNDGVNGGELWKSDGTAAGTVLVKDINPGAGLSSLPYPMFAWGGKLYCQASDGTSGYELWVSDGTSAGTTLILDIYTGTTSSSPQAFCDLGSKLLFFANDGVNGQEPWVTDGTTANTAMLSNINGTSASSCSSSLSTIYPVHLGYAYFPANNVTNGNELWRSDGTLAGTTLVHDVYAGASSSSPTLMTSVGPILYFRATDATTGTELWKTDGTSAGTSQVIDFSAGTTSSTMANLTNVGGVLMFSATDTTTGNELWKTNGTAVGTVQVKDINTTLAGASSSPTAFTALGSTLIFAANNGVVGTELWGSDGTTAGTVLLKDINQAVGNNGSLPANFANVNGKLFFAANDGVNGVELWMSDGTAAGTVLVKDINTTTATASSSPAQLTALGNRVVFTANDGVSGIELWASDGTAAGTVLLKDVYPGLSSSSPGPLYVSNGKIFFSAADSTATTGTGREVYTTDGTPAGTAMIVDLIPGTGSGMPSNSSTGMTPFKNGVMFRGDNGTTGTEPFFTDGTAAGTTLVKDINPGIGASSPFPMVNVNGTVYMQAAGTTSDWELWKSDGTAAGTVLIKDIYPGASASFPANFTPLGNLCVFTAGDGTAVTGTGTEIYVTDGTTAGTVLLKDTWPGTSSGSPSGLVNIGNAVLFLATDGTAVTGTGRELYRTDGTPAGTVLLKDVNPGTLSGCSASPSRLGAGNRILFNATNGVDGNELWTSDGTVAGTVQFSNLAAGSLSSSPANFLIAGTNVYFQANNATNGAELFLLPLSTFDVPVAENFGLGCAGTAGKVPSISSIGAPTIGNATWGVGLANAFSTTPALLFLNNARADLSLGACTLYPALPAVTIATVTDAAGAGSTTLPLANNVSWVGLQLYFQWVAVDPAGAYFGLVSFSDGLRVMIGKP